MEYLAVVFDMDGVIFDSEREVMNCWIALAEKYGIRDIEKIFCFVREPIMQKQPR